MLETVITVAIVAVLATLMIPPLFEQTQAARVDATAREMAASVRLARAEARARNRLVYIGANNNDWSNGWRVWIDDNNELIRSLPDRYPNVVVVDWEAEAEQIRGADHEPHRPMSA